MTTDTSIITVRCTTNDHFMHHFVVSAGAANELRNRGELLIYNPKRPWFSEFDFSNSIRSGLDRFETTLDKSLIEIQLRKYFDDTTENT